MPRNDKIIAGIALTACAFALLGFALCGGPTRTAGATSRSPHVAWTAKAVRKGATVIVRGPATFLRWVPGPRARGAAATVYDGIATGCRGAREVGTAAPLAAYSLRVARGLCVRGQASGTVYYRAGAS